MHYYQHHIGDFIKATARLSDSQTIVYLRLLWMYYDSEKPLKDDLEVLAMQTGGDLDDVDLLLRAYFNLQNGVWHHNRCDLEIGEYHALIAKKSNAGKASVQQRKNKRSTGVQQTFDTLPTDVQLTNNHEPVTNNQEQVVKSNRGSRLPAEFSLSDDWKAFCQQERQDLNPHKVFAEFKDYWIAQPGQKGVKTDWDATWRNWVRRQNAPRQNPADIARVTVPSRQERDPALAKLDQDRQLTRPPDLETLAKIAELKRRQA